VEKSTSQQRHLTVWQPPQQWLRCRWWLLALSVLWVCCGLTKSYADPEPASPLAAMRAAAEAAADIDPETVLPHVVRAATSAAPPERRAAVREQLRNITREETNRVIHAGALTPPRGPSVTSASPAASTQDSDVKGASAVGQAHSAAAAAQQAKRNQNIQVDRKNGVGARGAGSAGGPLRTAGASGGPR
jgi:hypothetical protein